MFKGYLSGCLLAGIFAGIFGLYMADSSAQSGIDSYTKLMLHADGSDQGDVFHRFRNNPQDRSQYRDL